MRQKYGYGPCRFLLLCERKLLQHHLHNVCNPISFGHEATFVEVYFLSLLLKYEDVPKGFRPRNEYSYQM